MRFMTCIIDGITVETALHKLHSSDLFHTAVTVKSGMQHFSSAEVHGNMKELAMPEEGDHIALLSLVPGYFHKTAPLLFLLVPVTDAEISIVMKLYAKFPPVELNDKSPAVKERVLPAVRCVSDEKIMVKPHT